MRERGNQLLVLVGHLLELVGRVAEERFQLVDSLLSFQSDPVSFLVSNLAKQLFPARPGLREFGLHIVELSLTGSEFATKLLVLVVEPVDQRIFPRKIFMKRIGDRPNTGGTLGFHTRHSCCLGDPGQSLARTFIPAWKGKLGVFGDDFHVPGTCAIG